MRSKPVSSYPLTNYNYEIYEKDCQEIELKNFNNQIQRSHRD